jgi:Cu/Ag efflux protein CusF
MDFKVAKASILDEIKPGDAVTFKLVKNDKTGKWLIARITSAR